MNVTIQPRTSAHEVVTTFRGVIERLLSQEWPPDYLEGLGVLVRQLIGIEGQQPAEVDPPLVSKLLPVIDALERARLHANKRDPEWAPRFDWALDVLVRVLKRHGVRPDRPLGAEFDPRIHEAVGVLETERIPSDRVVQITERGWYLDGHQIRPSKVVVSKLKRAA